VSNGQEVSRLIFPSCFSRQEEVETGTDRRRDQYVIPGNIIYKQRGTIWHPGENTIMGRNHTIHAAIHGYVKYYRDPAKHPDRQYIGVTHERHETLPYPVHGVRRRKLNMIAIPIKEVSKPPLMTASGIPRHIIRTDQIIGEKAKNPPQARAGLEKSAIRVLNLQDNYGYAESNAAIGRLMPKISFSNWKARVKDLETRNRKTPSKRTKAAAMP